MNLTDALAIGVIGPGVYSLDNQFDTNYLMPANLIGALAVGILGVSSLSLPSTRQLGEAHFTRLKRRWNRSGLLALI